VRTSISTGILAVPIRRESFSDDIVVGDDMGAPSQKIRDAILGRVASWGDRTIPMHRITAKTPSTVNVLEPHSNASRLTASASF
jgi:hypothetical protein